MTRAVTTQAARPGSAASFLRNHALILTALAVGLVLRGVVGYAYRPAMFFSDGFGYLARADPFQVFGLRPSGYSLFLRPFVLLLGPQPFIPIVAAQALMGVGLAALCYAFLVRRGLPQWGATLAVLPILLDPLQLVLEHYVLSDVLFEVMLVGACLLLLWRHRPGLPSVVIAGVLVGSLGLVRGAGTFLIVVFLVALVCLRVRWTKIVAFVLAAIVPLTAYAVDFHRTYGEYAITTSGPRFLYARLAPVVRCKDPQLKLPSYEQSLCPVKRVGHRPNTNWYMWRKRHNQQWNVAVPKGMTQVQVVKDFDKRVVRSQPVVYTQAALVDLARGFSPTRTTEVPGYPSSYWLFADHYWSVDEFIKRHVMSPNIRKRTYYDPTAAQFLTTYRQWVYTPGPLMAVLLLVAAGAALGLGRARRSGDRVAIGLLAASCLVPVLTGAALSGFSWRYQLPQIPLFPMAGALGLAALLTGRRAGKPAPAPPLRILDRSVDRVGRLPMPSSWRPAVRRAVERGLLQVGIAVLVGVVVAFPTGVLAVASGWFAPPTAAVIGLVLGALTSATLLLARRREASDAEGSPVTTDGIEEDRSDDEPVPTGS